MPVSSGGGKGEIWNMANQAVELAVCGLHMKGFLLEGQLTELGAVYDRRTKTAPHYLLMKTKTIPEKPMLVNVAAGYEIEVEIWKIGLDRIGQFLMNIPAPLGLGEIELTDGNIVIGFIGQAGSEQGLEDISETGGWRYYVNS